MKFKTPENFGVSPVIGIILMVAVSVALVVLASTLVFDISGNVNEPSTGYSVNIEEQQQSDNILVSVNQNPDLERVFVRGDGINGEQEVADGEGQTGTITVSPSSTEGTVEVVGETEDGTEQVLDTREYEDYSGTGSGKKGSGTGGSLFVFKVKTDNSGDTADNRFRIRTNDNLYTYNYNVSTDGTIVNPESELNNVTGDLTLEFSSKGVYEIKINGKMPHLYYERDSGSDDGKITSIEQWGSIQWKNMSYMFSGATNLDSYNAQDEPDLSNVKNMSYMFGGADEFNGDIGDWDTSNVEDMSGMLGTSTFLGADPMSFNQDISGWDTGNVRNMSMMFYNAESFNQDISGWDTSNVQSMRLMFAYTSDFNQDIGSWDTSNVESIRYMFYSASNFNQSLNSWDTSNVQDMKGVFRSTSSFNQSLNSWDTSNVQDMTGMFEDAYDFNQSLSSWDTSNVQYMENMFNNAINFNQDISSWCVSQFSNEPSEFDDYAPIDGTSKVPTWDSSDGC